jgi:hypothetical protein
MYQPSAVVGVNCSEGSMYPPCDYETGLCLVAAGSKLLAESLSQCTEDPGITQAVLHVHTANAHALEWYERKGFLVRPVHWYVGNDGACHHDHGP